MYLFLKWFSFNVLCFCFVFGLVSVQLCCVLLLCYEVCFCFLFVLFLCLVWFPFSICVFNVVVAHLVFVFVLVFGLVSVSLKGGNTIDRTLTQTPLALKWGNTIDRTL